MKTPTNTNIVLVKRHQDCTVSKRTKKIKKNWQRYLSKQLIIAKYFRTKIIIKKSFGFFYNNQLNKGYYLFSKLHKKIGFRLPNIPNQYKKMHKIKLGYTSFWKYTNKEYCTSLILCEPAVIEPRLIEIFRRMTLKSAKKSFKKTNKNRIKWSFNLHPNQSITRKGRGTRMGTGKGLTRTWAYKAVTGKIFLSLKKNRLNRQPLVLLKKMQKIVPYKTKILKKLRLLVSNNNKLQWH